MLVLSTFDLQLAPHRGPQNVYIFEREVFNVRSATSDSLSYISTREYARGYNEVVIHSTDYIHTLAHC